MKFFHASVVGHAETNLLMPAILGSPTANPRSHKLYFNASERSGRWTHKFVLTDEGFGTTNCTVVMINLDDYKSVEIWFEVDHRMCPPDVLAPVYTRMEWTRSKGWDITNIVYQRDNKERVSRPAIIGETTF